MTDTPPERIWALADRRRHWQEEEPSDGQHSWHWEEYILATTHQSALDRIAEQDKRIAELEAVVEYVRTYREECHNYDDENGHDPRGFDEEDLWILEETASRALSPNTTGEATTEGDG